MSDLVTIGIFVAVIAAIVLNGVKSASIKKTLDELQAKIDELRRKS